MSDGTVPLKYLKTFIRVAEAQGYDVIQIAHSIGLNSEYLSAKQDGRLLIPAEVYNRLYTHVMGLLEDETFGLQLAHKIPTGSFRMMCRTLIHSDCLEEAMTRAAEFHIFCKSLAGQEVMFKQGVERLGNNLSCYRFFDSKYFFLDDINDMFYGIANCIIIWHRFLSWLIGKQLELIEVHFQMEAPIDQRYLRKLFDCTIKFSQPHNAFVFSSEYLKAPLVHDESSLKAFLRTAPYQLLVTSDLENDDGIVAQMRRIIGHDLSREFPSVVAMAYSLNVSVRTLRRRLKEVGTTYQSFKDQTRCFSAKQLLSKPELKINTIAALLGFDEPSAFHRSFKKWTKKTPGEFRQSMA